MRRLRGRVLNPEGDGDCYLIGCLSPPSPFEFRPSPAPAPAPRRWPSSIDPCPPVSAPAPVPVHGAPWGRRDQGRAHGYGSPPGSGGGDSHRRVVTYALIAVAAIFFVSLILLGVSVAVRRRQVRRRRQALLAAPAGAAAAPDDADGWNDPEDGGGGGGVVHHVWYIRTVGLDEAAIHSIAATRYRAGTGLLGAADCTVCLGEFQDGELVRLLPKCGHAFHVPCIDTWLRAHVNCPLCRSDVLDPAVTADSGGGAADAESVASTPDDPVANDNTAAEEEADATSDAMAEQEQEESNNNRGASPAEEDRHEQSNVPEPPPQIPCPRPQNVRRAASMDAAVVSTVAAALERLPEAAHEEEQSGRRKRGATGPSGAKESDSGHRSNLSTDRPASVGIPRSFFSRHCRARSSVLPL